MTKAPVTISYGHAICDDCTEVYSGSYVKTEDGQTGVTLTVSDDDIYDIEATGSGGNHVAFYSYPDEAGAGMGHSSTVYTKIRFRYKAGGSTMRAKILLIFSTWDPGLTEAQNVAAGNAQIVLAECAPLVWTTGVATITPGKLIDHIRLYCNNAIGHVYYEFWMIYKNDFSLPNTKYGSTFIAPGRLATNESIGAEGDEIQNLGTKSAILDVSCDLDIGTWTRTGDTMRGQIFLEIQHKSATEPFQWLDTGEHVCQFKALLDSPEWQNNASEGEAAHVLHIVFREFRQSPANSETVEERFGLAL